MNETRQNHNGHMLDSINGFDVIECEQCGFKHIVPILTTNEIVSLYPDDYFSKEKPYP